MSKEIVRIHIITKIGEDLTISNTQEKLHTGEPISFAHQLIEASDENEHTIVLLHSTRSDNQSKSYRNRGLIASVDSFSELNKVIKECRDSQTDFSISSYLWQGLAL